MSKRRQRTQNRHRRVPDPLAARIGARIRRMRREQAFSFDAFVEETGLGRGYISELERGLVVPTVGALQKVARALEVTIADLVLGESPREQLFELTATLSSLEIERLLSGARGLAKPRAPDLVASESQKVLRTAEPIAPRRPTGRGRKRKSSG